MNKHLIGAEILSLAEDGVPPEDLIFHKFYVNKMSSSTKPKKKKKKKAANELGAEDLYAGDESDNEEIENDATEPSLEADGDYDYDDLDNVANEDDDDLIGNVSDNEMEIPSDNEEAGDVPDFGPGESDDEIDDIDANDFSDEEIYIGDADDASDGEIDIGDADDASDDEDDNRVPKKGKRRSARKFSASPFAGLEEYEHLLNDDNSMEEEKFEKKDKVRPRKERKSRE